ncbi:MAG TPA: translation initiation factor IF-3 [Thermotogota bacterium]|nr:translation initiation factor IF-3 [Thermotogota bacterium]HPJ89323.1 translation initiation factor IF-3 [Thermotogota bacterium]HPR97138.1 translation initiation factor IF-3 [Thermotogota bacterium]
MARAKDNLPPKNGEISAPKVRVIGKDGEQIGIMKVKEAISVAQRDSLDLVLVAPEAKPPVAKIVDFGKYRYELQKKKKTAQKNQKKTELKQMKFRPKIDEHDYQTKLNHIIRFLKGSNMVRVTIMFRGREMAFTEMGRKILDRIAEDTTMVARVTAKPKMEGRDMHMTLSPLSEVDQNRVAKKVAKEPNEADNGVPEKETEEE